MSGDPLTETARRAARAWGEIAGLSLVARRENAVFALTLTDGRKLALRLHRPGYNGRAEIESELWWTAALARRGFPAPPPAPTGDGRLVVALPDGQLASAVAWVAGRPLGAGGTPLPGRPAERRRIFHALGDLLARLHAVSDELDLPAGFTRRRWDRAGLVGDSPHWGRFWTHPALTDTARDLIERARDHARKALRKEEARGADFGLIHADALRENVFLTARPGTASRQELTLIDFDDAGFGFRLYDLAVALSQNVGDAEDSALEAALLEGYAARRPLGATDRAALPLFRMLRALASLGWTMGRMAADDPAIAPYLARAVTLAKRVLSR